MAALQTAALRRFRLELSRAVSPQEVASAALDCLRGVSAGLRAAVLLLEGGATAQVAASQGLSESARALLVRHAPRPGAAAPPWAERGPWLVDLEHEDWAAARAALAAEHIRIIAFVPCCYADRALGMLALCLPAASALPEQTMPLAETLAAELALVIEHRRSAATAWEGGSWSGGELGRVSDAPLPSSARDRERTQLLAAASSALASWLDPDTALQKLASLVVPAIADYAITYGCEGQTIRRLGWTHRDPTRLPLIESLLASGEPSRDDPHGPGAVIRTGAPILAQQVTDEMIRSSTRNAKHAQAVLALAPRSSMVIPLSSRGRIIGAISFAATDESGRRYDEDDLRFACELAQRVALLVDNARLYREAREAIRMRDDILAVVSHDLRNPLNTISVASSLLELAPSPEVSAKARRSITRAAKQMDRLIADLLDVSRAEAGGLALKLIPLDVAHLIDEAYALALPQAEDKKVKLERRVAADLCEIDGDRDRLLQVLNNLLGNAIKFVPSGGSVTIGAQELYGQIRVWISDDGPGIAAEHVARVFDRFWQANRQGSRGAGLGLTIAKSIVDAHGGQIGVHSHEGEGSTFFCWLPTAGQTLRSPNDPASPSDAVPSPRSDGARESAALTPPAIG